MVGRLLAPEMSLCCRVSIQVVFSFVMITVGLIG
jgi:hypothetical protein